VAQVVLVQLQLVATLIQLHQVLVVTQVVMVLAVAEVVEPQAEIPVNLQAQLLQQVVQVALVMHLFIIRINYARNA